MCMLLFPVYSLCLREHVFSPCEVATLRGHDPFQCSLCILSAHSLSLHGSISIIAQSFPCVQQVPTKKSLSSVHTRCSTCASSLPSCQEGPHDANEIQIPRSLEQPQTSLRGPAPAQAQSPPSSLSGQSPEALAAHLSGLRSLCTMP